MPSLNAQLPITDDSALSLRLIEIRTYRLKPNTLVDFDRVVHEKAVPMLRACGMDVVAYGCSNHEEESYFLIRAYANREALNKEQSAFYGSTQWKSGPRSELVDRIETYLNTLIFLPVHAVDGLRNANLRRSENILAHPL